MTHEQKILTIYKSWLRGWLSAKERDNLILKVIRQLTKEACKKHAR